MIEHSKSGAILAKLSETEFRAISELRLDARAEKDINSILYRLSSRGEIRCRKRMMKDRSGKTRNTATYAIGTPETLEELQYMAFAQGNVARKNKNTCKSIRKATLEARARGTTLYAEKKAKRPSDPDKPSPQLNARIDPMIWATCGRKVPELMV